MGMRFYMCNTEINYCFTIIDGLGFTHIHSCEVVP